jgi:hypothetical protein
MSTDKLSKEMTLRLAYNVWRAGAVAKKEATVQAISTAG